jgi:hypothetical protein
MAAKPDSAHAVGAPLRPPTAASATRPARSQTMRPSKPATEALPRAPDHPHIQHANLGTTSIYLQGIDNAEIIDAVHTRRAPMIQVSASLRL